MSPAVAQTPFLSWAMLLQSFEQHRQFYCVFFLGMLFCRHAQAPCSCTPLVRGHLVSAVSPCAGSTQHDSGGTLLRVEGESLMKTCPHHFKCVFNDALHLLKLISSLHKGGCNLWEQVRFSSRLESSFYDKGISHTTYGMFPFFKW